MILTVLIGNTNTRFAWFRRSRLTKSSTIPTAAVWRGALPGADEAAAVALASVVPDATRVVRAYLRTHAGLEPLVVGPLTRTGLTFRYRRRELGADRLCAAVGAKRRFPGHDLLVFDFGTATTANVILREGIFAGGAILPGVGMSFEALAAGTARVPKLSPGRLLDPVQLNTRTAVRSGIANLYAGGIERIIDRAEHITRRRLLVVSTGGGADAACRYVTRLSAPKPHLASEGLAEILYLNGHLD